MNYSSITSKTGTTRTPTSRPQSTTPMTTLTSAIAWRACTESARTAHLFHSCDCLTLHIPWLKSSALSYLHPWSSTWRTLLDSTSPFFFYLFLLSVPVFVFHLELFPALLYTKCMANNLRCSAAGHPELLHLSHRFSKLFLIVESSEMGSVKFVKSSVTESVKLV